MGKMKLILSFAKDFSEGAGVLYADGRSKVAVVERELRFKVVLSDGSVVPKSHLRQLFVEPKPGKGDQVEYRNAKWTVLMRVFGKLLIISDDSVDFVGVGEVKITKRKVPLHGGLYRAVMSQRERYQILESDRA